MPSKPFVFSGYLKWFPPASEPAVTDTLPSGLNQANPPITECFCQLTQSRVLFLYRYTDSTTKKNDPELLIGSFPIQGFCAWDGYCGDNRKERRGHDGYGLELKTKDRAFPTLYVAAFNRLDLDNWCRSILAALDPTSAAADDIRRERKRAKRLEKKKTRQHDQEQQMWRERAIKLAERARVREAARVEEIKAMTPLERSDGLGTLDDDTAKVLEQRKQRITRRWQKSTTERVTRHKYRRRVEEAAGGRIDKVDKIKKNLAESGNNRDNYRRFEAPPPGQFFEATGAINNSSVKRGTSTKKIREKKRSMSSSSSSDYESRSSSPSDSQSDYSSESSNFVRKSSKTSTNNKSKQSPPLPPPPPSEEMYQIGSHPPPPPPPPPSEIDDILSQHQPPPPPPPPPPPIISPTSSHASSYSAFSQSSFRKERSSSVLSKNGSIQSNLAAILAGSVGAKPRRSSSIKKANEAEKGGFVSQTNLASYMSPTASVSSRKNGRVRNRTRDKQLSDEGKNLFANAMSNEKNSKITGNDDSKSRRKGLFDDSSSSSSEEEVAKKSVASPKTNIAAVEAAFRNSQKLILDTDSEDSDSSCANNRQSRFSSHNALQVTSNHKEQWQTSNEIGDSNSSNGDNVTSPRSVVSSAYSATTSFEHSRRDSNASNTNTFRGGVNNAFDKMVAVYISSTVERKSKLKKQAMYTFEFQLGRSLTHRLTLSYHELEEIHSRLATEFVSPITLPKFPSKHWYRDNTKPENILKRANEFVGYFQLLLRIPEVLLNQRFHFEYKLPPQFIEILCNSSIPPTSKSPLSSIHEVKDSNTSRNSISSSSNSSFRANKSRAVNTSSVKNSGSSRVNIFSVNGDSSEESSDDSDESIEAPEPRFSYDFSPANKTPSRKKEFSPNKRPTTKNSHNETNANIRSLSSSCNSSDGEAGINSPVSAQKPKQVNGLPKGAPLFGGGRGDLLASIRKGAQLSSGSKDTNESTTSIIGNVEAAGRDVSGFAGRGGTVVGGGRGRGGGGGGRGRGGGRGDLLAAIRQAPKLSTLKTVESEIPTEIPPPMSNNNNDSSGGRENPGTMFDAISQAMAQRRVHIKPDESDSDSDWDD